MPDSTYPAYPIVAFGGFVFTLLPLTWLTKRSAGTLICMFWVAIACLNQFVNSIIWHDHSLNVAPLWTATRLMVAIGVAIPASVLCIIRRIYHILTFQFLVNTPLRVRPAIQFAKAIERDFNFGQKQRALCEDVCIGLGIPVLQMAVEYTLAYNRFQIFEGIGCFPATHNVWPALFLVSGWPLAIGLASSVYGVLTIRIYLRSRKQTNDVLRSAGMSRDSYWPILTLAYSSIVFTVPLSATINALKFFQMQPWTGWHDTHAYYHYIDQHPIAAWKNDTPTLIGLELFRWTRILCAVVFYANFGFSEDARRAYKHAFSTLARPCGTQVNAQTVNDTLSFRASENPVELSSTRSAVTSPERGAAHSSFDIYNNESVGTGAETIRYYTVNWDENILRCNLKCPCTTSVTVVRLISIETEWTDSQY
ncbi:STE3-domain-containing protein [Rickenella mellea]|uniref:STE3-domain-containing protein n=1 Tax=Rickenella mellea TaxID=50990 RepID=A0A4Y7QH06_9AGAM|nr:STE3-domain-containing protein [Rickenella mellea]